MQVSVKIEAIIIGALIIFGTLVGGMIYYEHDARVAEAAHLEDIKKTTDAAVAALKVQADLAEKVALQTNAGIVAQLAQQNTALQGVFNSLSAQLAGSRARETQQVASVQSMPIADIVKALKTELGSTASYDAATGTVSGLDPLSLRKLQTSLVELESCKEQSILQATQTANCQQQQAGSALIIATQKQSIEQMAKAVDFKDQILAQRDEEHKAEVRVLKGTFVGRLVHKLAIVGGIAGAGVAGYEIGLHR